MSMNPIGSGPADCQQLKEIRHAKLGFAIDSKRLKFFYVGKIKRTKSNDIKSYIKDIATHSGELTGKPCYEKGVLPLDLHSEEPCYFVIELDDAYDWQFSSKGPAITTKVDHSKDYCELQHVRPGGSGEPGKGCRVIHFAAVNPPGLKHPGQHPFNFHVEFLQDDGEYLSIIIDPDVRFPGGHGQ